jgi:hypothetical protein
MNPTVRSQLPALMLCAFAGCASPPPIPYQDVSIPPLDKTSSANLGEALLMQATGYYTDVLHLDNLNGKFATISAGDYCRLPGRDDYFSFNDRAVVYINFVGGERGYGNTVTYDAKSNEVCLHDVWSGCFDTSFGRIDRETNALCSDPNAYQQVIEYNGKSGTVLNFTYREFNGKFMRAPFTTSFTMDEADGDVVNYKGASLKVIKATNQTIEYVVLKNFNAARSQ